MRILGIDLGTTNSLVGAYVSGRPKLFEGASGSVLIPSVVSFDANGEVENVGEDAKFRKGAPNVVYSAKRFIGKIPDPELEKNSAYPFQFDSSDPRIVQFKVGPAQSVTPVEVAAHVLKQLKTIAERALTETVSHCVITVPAYFDDTQRQATRQACILAGLEVVRMVNEPTAACLAYGLNQREMGRVAVFDFGGGTFDMSVLKVSQGVFEVLSTRGDTALGGDDLDFAIARGISEKLKQEGQPVSWQVTSPPTILVLKSEEIKKCLTEDRERLDVSFEVSNQFYQTSISQNDVRQWTRPVLERLKPLCEACIHDAKLKLTDLQDVVLVGGSTRFFLVREWVRDFFQKEPLCTINPDEVVALGATVQANILSGRSSDMLLLDVIPLSLGIETVGSLTQKIIHRNTTIPTSASQTFSTSVDNQTGVVVHVLQGERELVKDNRSLARFELKIPPMPAGIPKIEVEFVVDANGILSISARELRTSQETAIRVTPSAGLTDEEVEKRLLESFEHAESDFSSRFLIEARVEADHLIQATQKSLRNGKDVLLPEEATEIQKALEDLSSVRDLENTQIIKEKIEALSRVTQKFAERLLDFTISETLKGKSI